MKAKDAKFIRLKESELFHLITKTFPRVPFDRYYRTEKFVGIMQVQGQKPVALFITSNQPIIYDEVILNQ